MLVKLKEGHGVVRTWSARGGGKAAAARRPSPTTTIPAAAAAALHVHHRGLGKNVAQRRLLLVT